MRRPSVMERFGVMFPDAMPGPAALRRTALRLAAPCMVAFGLATSAPCAHAQQSPQPTCDGAQYRQFDFWLGEWDVTVQGRPAGRSVISSREKGCLIHEQWTATAGGTGHAR